MTRILFLAVLLAGSLSLSAQSVTGLWKTIDDNSGKARTHVRIAEVNGKLVGTVEQLLLKPNDTICEACTGERKGKPVRGMAVLYGFKPGKGTLSGGKLFDPESDKEYRGKLWLSDNDPNVLNVRGYIGPFFRTQKWYRIQE